jgi:hypothetical protein
MILLILSGMKSQLTIRISAAQTIASLIVTRLIILIRYGVQTSDPNANTWVFVHEFGHVWQYYYGVKPINGWIYGAIKYGHDYAEKMYPYDLTQYKRFKSYNIEQQASIVADYWAVSFSRPARHCLKPKSPTDSDYTYLMMQVQNAEKPPSL